MKSSALKILKVLGLCAVFYFAVLAGGFWGVKKGYTNEVGTVDENNEEFSQAQKEIANLETVEKMQVTEGEKAEIDQAALREKIKNQTLCKIKVLSVAAPANAKNILTFYQAKNNDVIVAKMILAAKLRLMNQADTQAALTKCETDDLAYSSEEIFAKLENVPEQNVFSWMNSAEWKTIKEATLKDKTVIYKAAEAAGIEPRLLVASLIVEQVRLFNSQREIFKKFFEPLKILGNATKFSLGVMGIKEKTAIDVENHLKDRNSPYYLGTQYENILDFKTKDPTGERYLRLTNDKDHYYCYLYGALYLKEMLSQWQKANYDIEYRPEIVGTLFNVGFPQSKPKADPKVGGSAINVGTGKYSFGSLSYEFYYSGEMQEDFPFLTE